MELLAIAPHPDDAEICCGGFLAKASRLGYEVALTDLTRGEMGSRGTTELRAEEAAEASKALGLSHRENLGLPDGMLSASDATQLITIVRMIRRLRPEVVLAPYWKGRHPDHIAASELATKAVFFANLKNFDAESGQPKHQVKQLIYYFMRALAEPSFIVDVSEDWERKKWSYLSYRSQLGLFNREKTSEENTSTDKEPATLVSSPLSVPSVESRDSFYGAMIGVKYGEPFLVRNTLSLSDPIAHFRGHPSMSGSLFFTGNQ